MRAVLVLLMVACLVILFVVAALIKRFGHAPKKKATPPLAADEQVAASRVYVHVVPLGLMLLGGAAALFGLVLAIVRYEEGIPLLFLGLLGLAIGYFMMKVWTFTLTVTHKRVCVQSIFSYRKSLPIRRISAVGTFLFGTLYVGSSAGRILLPFVPNHLEVYDAINAMLAQVE